jgi:hypothetical protein
MKFWLLSYVYKAKPDAPMQGESFANVLLAGIHPLVWLSTPSDSYRKHFIQHALHFCEIDQATFEEVKALNYVNCEDHRPVDSLV